MKIVWNDVVVFGTIKKGLAKLFRQPFYCAT